MKMNEGLDTGDIIYQEPIPIDDNDSSKDMHNKFITLGIDSLLLSLDSILENNFMLHPQDWNLATYAKKIKKDEILKIGKTPLKKFIKKSWRLMHGQLLKLFCPGKELEFMIANIKI